MKKFIAAGIALTVLASEGMTLIGYNFGSVSREIEGLKVAEGLSEALCKEKDTYPVIIWINDIDHEKVSEQVEQKMGYGWDEIYDLENNCISEALLRNDQRMKDKNDWYFVDEDYKKEMQRLQRMSNELIIAQRGLSKERYVYNNNVFAEKTGILENCFFISGYSPMLFANLTEDEICDLSNNRDVVSLEMYEEVVCDNNVDSAEDKESDEIKNMEYLSYISYINAAGPKSAGINGTDVKVGLVDSKLVSTSDHSELSDSNIVQVGLPGGTDTHAILMARTICGSNGMAPGCTLYSGAYSSSQNTYATIELLLDNGVSVINYSIGASRQNDYYNNEEKWIDHIAPNHGVTFVKSAGNSGGYISIPGLAYNTITVGSVNYITDTIETSSAYLYGSTGCQKPDVVAPGNGIISNGGTSAAAACTTGMIALMLHVKPSIKQFPAVVKAVTMAGCDHNAGETTFPSGFKLKQGAGVINCGCSLGILSANKYYMNYSTSNGTINKNITVASSSAPHSAVLVGLKMVSISGNHMSATPTVFPMPTLMFRVFTSSGSLISQDGGAISATCILRFLSPNTNFKLQVDISGISVAGLPYAFAWR